MERQNCPNRPSFITMLVWNDSTHFWIRLPEIVFERRLWGKSVPLLTLSPLRTQRNSVRKTVETALVPTGPASLSLSLCLSLSLLYLWKINPQTEKRLFIETHSISFRHNNTASQREKTQSDSNPSSGRFTRSFTCPLFHLRLGLLPTYLSFDYDRRTLPSIAF